MVGAANLRIFTRSAMGGGGESPHIYTVRYGWGAANARIFRRSPMDGGGESPHIYTGA